MIYTCLLPLIQLLLRGRRRRWWISALRGGVPVRVQHAADSAADGHEHDDADEDVQLHVLPPQLALHVRGGLVEGARGLGQFIWPVLVVFDGCVLYGLWYMVYGIW